MLGASEAFHIDQDDTMSDGGWIDWSGFCDLGNQKSDGDSTGLQSILQMETFPLLYYTGARHDEVGLSLFEQVVYGSPLGFS